MLNSNFKNKQPFPIAEEGLLLSVSMFSTAYLTSPAYQLC